MVDLATFGIRILIVILGPDLDSKLEKYMILQIRIWIHKTGFCSASCHPVRGEEDPEDQDGEPGAVRLGDKGAGRSGSREQGAGSM